MVCHFYTPEYQIALSIVNVKVDFSLPTYVNRPTVEKQLDRFFSVSDDKYAVVVGPRGCGKSTVVDGVASNHSGVIAISLGITDRAVDVYEKIVKRLGHQYAKEFEKPDEELLRQLFLDASTKYNRKYKTKTWVPTIVAELTNSNVDSSVSVLTNTLKRLNSDKSKVCRVIMVLSDANAAFGLPPDPARQSIVWVDDFTIVLANEFFDKQQFLPLGVRFVNDTNGVVVDVNAQLRSVLFDKIGTRPIDLKDAISSIGSTNGSYEDVDQFVVTKVTEAHRVLSTLSKRNIEPTGDEFKTVVRSLLALGGDPIDGVSAESFDGTVGDARLVAQALKLNHALLYHFPTATYRFYSRAYYHAALQLKKEGLL